MAATNCNKKILISSHHLKFVMNDHEYLNCNLVFCYELRYLSIYSVLQSTELLRKSMTVPEEFELFFVQRMF